jgi:PAS domain S-box-containing protein
MIKESEAQYRAIFESMQEVFFVCEIIRDGAGKPFDIRYLDVNPACLMRARRKREEMVGHTYLELFPPNPTFENWCSHFARVTLSGESDHFELFAEATGLYFEVTAITLRPGQCAVIMKDISENKRADAQLRESEANFRALFNNNHAPMLLVDPETGKIVDANTAASVFYGWSLSEIKTKNIDEINILTHAEVKAEMQKALKEQRQSFLFKHRLANNQVCDVEVFSGPIKYSGRTLLYSIIHDITDRKQTEETLRQNEIRYRSLFENMLNGFAYCQMIYDPEGVAQDFIYLNVNRAFEKQTGLKDVAGKKASEVIPGIRESDTGLLEIYGRVAFTGVPETFEIYVEAMKMWFSISVYSPQKTYFVAVFDVITERKQSEEEIRNLNAALERRVQERTAELSDLFNNAPCGYHSLDENGVFVKINDTELNWLDLTREELIGKKRFIDLVTPASALHFQLNFPIFKARGWIQDLEFDMLRRDGSILPVLVNATAIHDANGHLLMSRSTVIDNSARKKSEQLKQEAQARLEAANKELEAFAYSVSHDLRAPLRGIDGWSLALSEDYREKLDETGRQYIDVVRSETQRMGQLIDDLLKLSRLTRVEMQQNDVNLSGMAQTIVRRLQKTQPDRSVEWIIQPDLMANGDAHLLEIALTNLLSNAFKFTGKQSQARIEMGRLQMDGKETYFIRDNGAGFNMAFAKNLFGAFQRMHRQSDFPGTGIGLATVQRIIHRHGGQIWAEAEKNVGATFYFTLEETA